MTIVEELRKNRESGARRLVAEYKAGLMTLARRFCHDPGDAEELVNRTFAAVVEGIDDYVEQSAFFGWMCQILTNINSMDKRRLANKNIVYPGVVPDVVDEDAHEAIYRDVDAALLRDAVDRLPKEQRELLALHYFMDMPVAKMAKILAMPVGTVRSKLFYARKALAAKLGVKAHEVANKPGVKAVLLALTLCAITAAGAVGIARWGELSERAAAILGSGGVVPRAAAIAETGGTDEIVGFSPVAPTPTPVPPDSPVPPVPVVPFVPGVPSTTLSGEQNMNTTTLRTIAASAAIAAASAAINANASAYEEWSGDDLTIHGDNSVSPRYIHEKKMDGETLSAANITLATEVGRARIVAINNSTITASTAFYLGKEASPGDYGLISTVVLTNSTLTTPDLYLGYDVQSYSDNTRLFMEIGPDAVVDCANITRFCGRTPVVKFTGGRMVFSGDDKWWMQNQKYRWLVYVNERTWRGDYPNGGVEFCGVGAPIDIEINNPRELARGLRSRTFSLTGNGGLIKRGAGTLIWTWYATDNSGKFGPIANYTGDTVIKGGAIQLVNTDVNATQQAGQTYSTPSGSALKIEAGAMFNLNGYPASFLGVSGAGTITNGAATATTLTLGESGGDGEFSPSIIGGEFDLVKLGAGTLTVGTATLAGSLSATGGTVKVASGASFVCRDIALDGTTLDIRGARVACDNLTRANGATILRDAATVLRVGPGATVMVFK